MERLRCGSTLFRAAGRSLHGPMTAFGGSRCQPSRTDANARYRPLSSINSPRRALAPRIPLPSTQPYHQDSHQQRSYATASNKPLTLPPSRDPKKSAKLSALHARLLLSPSFPLETLARCLIDPTASPNPPLSNNSSLANLGNNLLGYWACEHILVRYPRLPLEVLKAAMYAYISPKALAAVATGWGVEAAWEPTWEVDAGMLQFKRLAPGAAWGPERYRLLNEMREEHYLRSNPPKPNSNQDSDSDSDSDAESEPEGQGATATTVPTELKSFEEIFTTDNGIPLELAQARFVRALIAGIYLHESPQAAQHFLRSHVLARHLEVHKLFDISQPTRQLSRLCDREGFEPPVARLLSETGRSSRSPVYVVGVYSGEERLGEAFGASLDEARIKAAVAALKAWYLYSPVEALRGDVPSKTEIYGGEDGVVLDGRGKVAREKRFRTGIVDVGEVIV